jgi:fatty acid/phospholipid biosynthesis enzyme
MKPMSKKILITFNPDGTTEIKTSGFRGNSCMKAAEFLKKALGSVVKTKKTPEYFQTEGVQTAKARGSE